MSKLFNKFDLAALQAIIIDKDDNQRASYISLARTAEAAERYTDMCVFMRALATWCHQEEKGLEVEERNLLSVAYKNVVGSLRAAHRALVSEVDRTATESTEEAVQLLPLYKTQIEQELKAVCDDVIDLLESTILKNQDAHTPEANVFYLKMAGDYYRYLAETQKDAQENAHSFYKNAMTLAEEKLQPTNPIRLGLALNYSVCFYEILGMKAQACDLAKSAFDQAISKLDRLEEADYKDSTLIMQLLRDNLTLWTADVADDAV